MISLNGAHDSARKSFCFFFLLLIARGPCGTRFHDHEQYRKMSNLYIFTTEKMNYYRYIMRHKFPHNIFFVIV